MEGGGGGHEALGSRPHLCLIVPEGLPVAEPDLCSVTILAELNCFSSPSELQSLHSPCIFPSFSPSHCFPLFSL